MVYTDTLDGYFCYTYIMLRFISKINIEINEGKSTNCQNITLFGFVLQ